MRRMSDTERLDALEKGLLVVRRTGDGLAWEAHRVGTDFFDQSHWYARATLRDAIDAALSA